MFKANDKLSIETNNSEAKRKILEYLFSIQNVECTILEDGTLKLIATAGNSVIKDTIAVVVMENLIGNVRMTPVTSNQNTEEPVKETENKTEEKSAEKPEQELENELKKGSRKRRKVSDSLYAKITEFMRGKEKVTKKEICKELGIESNKAGVYLTKLKKRGEIENISKGIWKLKDTEEDILKLFNKGWKLTKEEIEGRLKLPEEMILPLLEKMEKESKIEKVGEDEYIKKKNKFGIFDDDSYSKLLEYIMNREKFREDVLKAKFPDDAEKIPKLIENLLGRYIGEIKNETEKNYKVYLKGRILYYLKNNPGETFAGIKTKFNALSNQDISNAINIAVQTEELKKDGSLYYVVKM